MKTVSCHRKYPITTNFLDTMLEHSVEIQEGETKLDAYRRGLKELDQIAAELRKEANPHLYKEAGNYIQPPKYEQSQTSSIAPVQIPAWSIPTISKDKERIEIEIDNASTIDELKAVKDRHELMPASCLTQYHKRMDELTSDRPQNFTDGLD